MTAHPLLRLCRLALATAAITTMLLLAACDALPLPPVPPGASVAGAVPLPGDSPLTQGSRIETGLCARQTLELHVPDDVNSVTYVEAPDAGVDLALRAGQPAPGFGAITIYQPPVVPPPTPQGAPPPPAPASPDDVAIEACENGLTVAISILERTHFDLATVPVPGAVIVRPGLTSNGPGYLVRARVDCGTSPDWVDFGQTTGPTGPGRDHFPAVAWQRALPIPGDPAGCVLQVRWIRTP